MAANFFIIGGLLELDIYSLDSHWGCRTLAWFHVSNILSTLVVKNIWHIIVQSEYWLIPYRVQSQPPILYSRIWFGHAYTYTLYTKKTRMDIWLFNKLSRKMVIFNILHDISSKRFSCIACFVWTVTFYSLLEILMGVSNKVVTIWQDIAQLTFLINNDALSHGLQHHIKSMHGAHDPFVKYFMESFTIDLLLW